MKTFQIAYCLIRKDTRNKYHPNQFSPHLYDERVPIFWKNKVAKTEAKKWDADVVKVTIKPEDD